MADLITQAELEDYLGTTLDNDRAALATRLASGAVRGYTRQLLDEVEGDIILIDGDGSDIILLPELPVLDITNVDETTGTTSPTTETLDEFEHFEWNRRGLLERIGRPWPKRRRSVEVTYSHGYATLPDDIVAVALASAARVIENPSGVRQESIGRYSYTFAGEGGAQAGILRGEARMLDRFRVDYSTAHEPVGS